MSTALEPVAALRCGRSGAGMIPLLRNYGLHCRLTNLSPKKAANMYIGCNVRACAGACVH